MILFLLTMSTWARSPELQVLDRLVGSWQRSVEIVGKPARKSVLTRSWSQDGEGDFLYEAAFDAGNQEEHVAVWTYDTRLQRYRCIMLKTGGPMLLDGRWDAETETFHFEILSFDQKWSSRSTLHLVSADRAEFALQFLHEGKAAWNNAGSYKRIAPPPAPPMPRGKPPEQLLLQRFIGSWTSKITDSATKKTHKNQVTTRWSGAGQGSFLISVETAADGGEKYSFVTYDRRGKIYRGCFLESGAAGFSSGHWTPETHTMHSAFFLFDLPRGVDGKPLAGASYADGIHGEFRERFSHSLRSEIELQFQFGGTLVWKGKGARNKVIDQDATRLLTLDTPAGKALMRGKPFEHPHGVGETISLGDSTDAADVFLHQGSIRIVGRPALCLNVSRNEFHAASSVNFWRSNSNHTGHLWRVNANHSLSPVTAPTLILGWQDNALRLVGAESDSGLIFSNITP